ncbi:MAG TPA: hypothetical protein VIY48_12310 [Candidatus Paceibacterota bacterium]
MQASNLVLTAGALAFVGSFKEAGGFPPNGYAVVGGTVALTFIASMTNGTSIEPAVKALAGLMILAAAMRYIPVLTNQTHKTKKKDKKHG